MMKTIGLLALSALSLLAADATGKWTGELTVPGPDGTPQNRPAYLVLKQENTTLTGTAGPQSDQQFDIVSGKADQGKLTFTVPQASMKFELVQNGDELTGEVTRERDGESQKATIKVKREK